MALPLDQMVYSYVFFCSLLATVKHQDAISLVSSESQAMMALITTTPLAAKHAKTALVYLTYLSATWLDKSLWSSWSQFGRDSAAARLNTLVEGVIPTINHLESFNGVLKRKYIPRWQRSGNRLRFDVFIHHLVTKILPDIFAQRRMLQHYREWVNLCFQAASGGRNLVDDKEIAHAVNKKCEQEIPPRRR